MEFKQNWEDTKKRFQDFWTNSNEERALIAVTAPNQFYREEEYFQKYDVERFADDDIESIKHWWCDVEENVKRNEYIFEHTFYGGEALPIAFTNWGAMAMCSFYGCMPSFNKKSVWYFKVIEDWNTWKWELDKNTNEFYQANIAITKAFAENSRDRYFAGMPELGSAGDLLSLMRGMDDMCLDIYDSPEELKAAIDFLTDAFLSHQDEFYDIIKKSCDGGSTLPWMSLWMPGRNGNQLACDFSWVISDHDFKTFFMDELRKESQWSDYATYHLDGPMCMKNHLDTLLEVEGIKAIEWTPGIGSPLASTAEYIPKYRKIQEKGKQLILIAEPQEIDILTKQLSPKGLFIKTTAGSQEEAEQLIKIAEKNAIEQKGRLFAYGS